MIIHILYDNVGYDGRFTPDWGFACLVQDADHYILFDTGEKGSILLENFKNAHIDPEQVDAVVLSHEHSDHAGGVLDFLSVNSHAPLYVPASFSAALEKNIADTGARIVSIRDAMQISPNAYLTGEMEGDVIEQALVLDIPKGLVVITGCAHPGIVHVVQKVKDLYSDKLNKHIHLILGGLHLYTHSAKKIKTIIQNLQSIGVESVAPSHCTGELATQLFQESWGGDFYLSGCGARFIFNIKSGV